jgi:hypothetical protein
VPLAHGEIDHGRLGHDAHGVRLEDAAGHQVGGDVVVLAKVVDEPLKHSEVFVEMVAMYEEFAPIGRTVGAGI